MEDFRLKGRKRSLHILIKSFCIFYFKSLYPLISFLFFLGILSYFLALSFFPFLLPFISFSPKAPTPLLRLLENLFSLLIFLLSVSYMSLFHQPCIKVYPSIQPEPTQNNVMALEENVRPLYYFLRNDESI